jgi:hypothetical protein
LPRESLTPVGPPVCAEGTGDSSSLVGPVVSLREPSPSDTHLPDAEGAATMPSMRTLMSALSLTLAVGCGGSTAISPQDGGRETDSGGQDSDDDAIDGGQPDATGPWSLVCPAMAPTAGATCTQDSLQCEYGDAWWSISCDQVLGCSHGVWISETPSASTCLPQPGPNPSSCPSNPSFIQNGRVCSQAGLTCYYGQGAICSCDSLPNDAGGAQWGCIPDPGCPSSRPRLGAPCTGTAACTYEACVFAEMCSKGVWQAAQIGCSGQ